MTWLKNKTTLLFVIVLLHNSLLDLFFVNHTGLVFLWHENGQLNTVLTHLLTASLVVMFFLLIEKLSNSYKTKAFKISERIWAGCSIILITLIGFLLI